MLTIFSRGKSSSNKILVILLLSILSLEKIIDKLSLSNIDDNELPLFDILINDLFGYSLI